MSTESDISRTVKLDWLSLESLENDHATVGDVFIIVIPEVKEPKATIYVDDIDIPIAEVCLPSGLDLSVPISGERIIAEIPRERILPSESTNEQAVLDFLKGAGRIAVIATAELSH